MSSFAEQFDTQSQWRQALREQVSALSRFLDSHGLADDAAHRQLALLCQRLHGEKLVVAFVAEFSRGKSELINAIFFGDAGRRVLPATPGRTTMCPVELGYDAGAPPSLALLPIASRLEGLSLAELRAQPARWTRSAIDLSHPETLPDALAEVTRTVPVSLADARLLGFWDDARPDDNPPLDAAGRALVPAWRHAVINYPHPLLRQGLVVLDTPGLNAIGAEPELTLGLLPSAHATVFVLGADTGVTKSDMAIWRDHLGSRADARFVVLNKIDALADPLLAPAAVAAQIESQCRLTAESLGVPPARVFALSARQALAARVTGDDEGLAASRIGALERALAAELLPQRRSVLCRQVAGMVQQVEVQVARQIGSERRQLAEQTLELRGLRGKSAARLRAMLARVEAEAAEFEPCTARLAALRTVHARMLGEMLAALSTDRLRHEVQTMQAELDSALLKLNPRRAFAGLCARLRANLGQAQRRDQELRDMLAAQFERLNAEFGFALALAAPAALDGCIEEFELIERNYVRYLGLAQALRLAQPKFREQFRRMLVSKLRGVFENASGELELWNKTASAQIDAQLRERRRSFRKRHEALLRIQGAAGELEQRITDLELHDARLQEQAARLSVLAAALQAVPDMHVLSA